MKQYDVNKDGKVNKCDSTIVQKYLAYLLDCPALDINKDGQVDYCDYEEWVEKFNRYNLKEDDKINNADVKIIQEAIAKLRRTKSYMDLDGNKKVNMSDVTLLQNVIASKKLDINKDKKITKEDGERLLWIIKKFEKYIKRMDVNKDGEVDMKDVVDIQRHSKK